MTLLAWHKLVLIKISNNPSIRHIGLFRLTVQQITSTKSNLCQPLGKITTFKIIWWMFLWIRVSKESRLPLHSSYCLRRMLLVLIRTRNGRIMSTMQWMSLTEARSCLNSYLTNSKKKMSEMKRLSWCSIATKDLTRKHLMNRRTDPGIMAKPQSNNRESTRWVVFGLHKASTWLMLFRETLRIRILIEGLEEKLQASR